MKKIKFLSMIFVLTFLLMTASQLVAFADEETKVNFRLVMLDTHSPASCNVFLYEYPSMDSDVIISETRFAVYRSETWEFKKAIQPGIYKVFVTIGGGSLSVFGESEMFEVRGDQMTVYIPVEDPDYPVDMPDEWLVYGEDNQNFYIWAKDEPDTSTSSDASSDSSQPVEVDPLPSTGSEVDEVSKDSSVSLAEDASIVQSSTTSDEIRTSAKIGNYIYVGLAIALLVGSVIALHNIKKRRGA